MPAELRREDLKEITAQPLLNYLLALSRTRGKLDFAAATNLNEIYEDLLAAIWERRWGELPLAGVRDGSRAASTGVVEIRRPRRCRAGVAIGPAA
jgi:hypothetical protein